MTVFSATNQPKVKGRPAGSKNKRSQFTDTLNKSALEQLTAAVTQGESWAVQLVIARSFPQLKAITPVDSLDGQLLQAKIKEVSEFEERLTLLEDQHAKH